MICSILLLGITIISSNAVPTCPDGAVPVGNECFRASQPSTQVCTWKYCLHKTYLVCVCTIFQDENGCGDDVALTGRDSDLLIVVAEKLELSVRKDIGY